MVRRDNDEIAGAQRRLKPGQPAIELFDRIPIAFHIVAMPVLLIEINQIHPDQASVELLRRFECLLHAICVARCQNMIKDSPAEEDIENLTHTEDFNFPVFEFVEQHTARRWNGVVVTVRSSHKVAGLTFEWARNNAAHLEGPSENFP